MRRDGDCSKCKYRETCGVERARMCAEMNAKVDVERDD